VLLIEMSVIKKIKDDLVFPVILLRALVKDDIAMKLRSKYEQ